MERDIEKDKKNFIRDECFALSWRGAVGTRGLPIYSDDCKAGSKKRKCIQNKVKKIIDEKYIDFYEFESRDEKIKDGGHLCNIKALSKEMTDKFCQSLHGKRFRIGTSQKVLNLYLKYLWCSGQIATPPHCPIDSIVLDEIGKEIEWKDLYCKECCKKIDAKKMEVKINWTELDCIECYKKIICMARKAVEEDEESDNLSEWELEVWLRRKIKK